MARVLCSVPTGLEGVAAAEVAERLGGGAAVDAGGPAGGLRLSLPPARLAELRALRCVGQLTLLLAEDAAFFGGGAADATRDLGRLRELGAALDWTGAAARRAALLPAGLPAAAVSGFRTSCGARCCPPPPRS